MLVDKNMVTSWQHSKYEKIAYKYYHLPAEHSSLAKFFWQFANSAHFFFVSAAYPSFAIVLSLFQLLLYIFRMQFGREEPVGRWQQQQLS